MPVNNQPLDPAAQQAAIEAAKARAAELARQEAERARQAEIEARGTGQEQVYFDDTGHLDRDTIARSTGMGEAYDEYAGADGQMSEDEFVAMQLAFDQMGGGTAAGAVAATSVVPAATTTPTGVTIPAAIPPGAPDPNMDLFLQVEDAKDVKAGYDQANSELQERLAAFGDALTPQQREAFTTKFWNDPAHQDRAAAKAGWETTQKEMAAYLSANQGAIARQILDAPDPALRDKYLGDLQKALGMAGDAAPGLAFGLGAAMLSMPEAAKGDMGEKIAASLIQPNMEARAAEHIKAAGGDAQKGMAAFAAELTGLDQGFEAAVEKTGQHGKTIGALKDGAEATQALVALFGEAGEKGPTAEQLGDLIDKYEEGPFGSTMKVLGLTMGAIEIKDAAQQGQVLDMIKSTCSTVKDAGEFLGRFDDFAGALGEGTLASERVFPILGAAAAGISGIQKAGKWKDDPDAMLLASALSDASVVAGSLLMMTPLAPAGAALVALGMATGFVFDKLYGNRMDERKRLESAAYLEGLGFEHGYADLLAHQPPGHISRLATAGLTPDQMAQLYRDGLGNDFLDGRIGDNEDMSLRLAALAERSQGGKLDVYGLMHQVAAETQPGDDRTLKVGEFQRALEIVMETKQESKSPQPVGYWQEQFRQLADPKGYYQGAWGASFAAGMSGRMAQAFVPTTP
jgi:hypothetical protein